MGRAGKSKTRRKRAPWWRPSGARLARFSDTFGAVEIMTHDSHVPGAGAATFVAQIAPVVASHG
jgi:hypothetical protein